VTHLEVSKPGEETKDEVSDGELDATSFDQDSPARTTVDI